MALCFPGVTWLLSTGALGLVVPSLPTVPSSMTGPEASHLGSGPGRLEVAGEGCSLVTGNSVHSSYSRIRRASLLERWSWAGLGWLGLAARQASEGLMGAAPHLEDTLGRQAVSGAPQVVVRPPPL